ncbi:MAG: two-component system response regulator [Desulfobulbus propionicus]|nr:MAG: two-component system response regulator [Desulfobulbus propionicus]
MDNQETPRILIVDDEPVHRFTLNALFKEWGWRTEEASDGAAAVSMAEAGPYDAILMDVRMAGMDGVEAMEKIQSVNPAIPVVIMTAYSSVDSAVEAMKLGARDYLTKPLDFDRLRQVMENAMGHLQDTVEDTVTPEPQVGGERLVGRSTVMRDLWNVILQVAPTEATVLVSGESGTGKELVATALHENSRRRKGPLVKVNCAVLAESLLESELFGHERGAFTGADRRREGRFIQAQGGTLFLDEVGEMSAAMQAKLLRVLQEHELERVGGQETLQVDVRIIAATNRILREEVAAGRFREDLFYRLNVVSLVVPNLRDRQGDVPLLAEFFLSRFAAQNNRQVTGITPECMDLLNRYPWPGNIRELEHCMERGVILMRGEYLDVENLPLTILEWAGRNAPVETGRPATLKEAEKALILQTLEETGGNRSEAARRLQITRKTLLNKLKTYAAEESGTN